MTRSLPSKGGKRIKSLDTAFEILDILSEDGVVDQSSIVSRTNNSKSTVHYHLKTLEAQRYIVKGEDGYRIGLRCLGLGTKALEQHAVPAGLNEEVQHLSDQVGSTAAVAIEECGKCIFIAQSSPTADAPVVYRVGAEYPLHTNAFGKALLAQLPESEVHEIIDYYGLTEITNNTITGQESLIEEIATIKDDDIATDTGEQFLDVSSIAAPIIGSAETVYGAVGIIGSKDTFGDSPTRSKAQRFAKTPVNAVKRSAHIIGNKIRGDS